MLIRKTSEIKPSEITPESIWQERRRFLKLAAAGTILFSTQGACGSKVPEPPEVPLKPRPKIPNLVTTEYGKGESLTKYEHITQYNNFLEFGSGKYKPSRYAKDLKTRPWSVTVTGECDAPGEAGIEDLLGSFPQEERIYRLRCVEAWAMVIPWVGFPLGDLLKRFKPNSQAKYVAFETLYDPNKMPGQRRGYFDWPYREGLRIDEAMHPLTIVATGLYGEELPGQNGAPLRLVVPWKYGYKSIKSIVSIRFTDKVPDTTWNLMQPEEYGFYSNVNPQVGHPRWSQKHHRMIGGGLFSSKVKTDMFNGYAEQVASLYSGMDLQRFY